MFFWDLCFLTVCLQSLKRYIMINESKPTVEGRLSSMCNRRTFHGAFITCSVSLPLQGLDICHRTQEEVSWQTVEICLTCLFPHSLLRSSSVWLIVCHEEKNNKIEMLFLFFLTLCFGKHLNSINHNVGRQKKDFSWFDEGSVKKWNEYFVIQYTCWRVWS